MEQRMERRLDTWLETGRQLVDGVSGRRPGQRRTSLDLDSMGRWVGEKVDWLLDDDDDWREPWQEQTSPEASSRGGKRPLQAVSRRLPTTAGRRMTVSVCSAGREPPGLMGSSMSSLSGNRCVLHVACCHAQVVAETDSNGSSGYVSTRVMAPK